MLKKKKGQSILEYVIVLTAVIACILWAAKTFIKDTVEQGLKDATTAVETAADNLPTQ
jgi:uncharacterized protein (UPF0333 family)